MDMSEQTWRTWELGGAGSTRRDMMGHGRKRGHSRGIVGQREHRNTEARDIKRQGTMASGRGGRWQEVMGASGTGDTGARDMETQGTVV